MSDQKPSATPPAAGSADSLIKSEHIALSESELEKVTGADKNLNLNKAKTADKSAAAMDAYIRG